MTVCKSCGAEITWAITPSGAKMPLDAKPLKGVYLVEGEQATPVLGTLHANHWGTCPHADEHRRGAKPEEKVCWRAPNAHPPHKWYQEDVGAKEFWCPGVRGTTMY
jgi:hypothetical protein